MKNFWQKFKKPILVLAPMAGITDAAFRFLCGKYGADVVYSEMISAAGLFYDSERTSGLLDSYKKNGNAKFVVQLFGNNPDHFAKAVKIIEKECKPDGIDINFGCPVPKVQKVGAGVKLFQDLEQAHRVIEACLRNTKLPISVKTRISVPAGKNTPRSRGAATPEVSGSCNPLDRGELKSVTVLDFIEKMKDLPIAALMVHGRTLAQGFSGEVDYELLNRAQKKFKGVFIANGGINDYKSAQEMLKKTGADGIGIGQAACGRPQIFTEVKRKVKSLKFKVKSNKEKINRPSPAFGHSTRFRDLRPSRGGDVDPLTIAWEHAKLMEKLKGKQGILEMRKHLCWYVKGLPGAAELRQEFVKVETLDDIKKLLK
jgi:tRNA-dihydrouridine synthase